MKNVYGNIFIGDIDSFRSLGPDNEKWAFVHATQTVHYNIFGKDKAYNDPEERNHDEYMYYEEGNRLSLNWIDGPAQLFELSGVETFEKALNFIDKWSSDKNVLIHCDQGVSRSPTLGLLYLAKRTDAITDESFNEAKEEFIKLYPRYFPGGIAEYVDNNWENIN